MFALKCYSKTSVSENLLFERGSKSTRSILWSMIVNACWESGWKNGFYSVTNLVRYVNIVFIRFCYESRSIYGRSSQQFHRVSYSNVIMSKLFIVSLGKVQIQTMPFKSRKRYYFTHFAIQSLQDNSVILLKSLTHKLRIDIDLTVC